MKKYFVIILFLPSLYSFSQTIELSKKGCNGIKASFAFEEQISNDLILEYEVLQDVWVKHELRSDVTESQLYADLVDGSYRASFIENDLVEYSNIVKVGCDLREPSDKDGSSVILSNPVESILYFSLNNLLYSYSEYTILDMTGKVIISEMITQNHMIVDIKNEQSGMYLLLLSNDQGVRLAEKFIKL